MTTERNEPSLLHPPVPREHGAWGILAGSFLLAAALPRTLTVGMALLLPGVSLLFFARYAIITTFRRRPRSRGLLWCALFTLAGLLFIAAAARAAGYTRIFLWFACLVPFFAAELTLIRSRMQQSFLAQLLGTIGLASTAPLTLLLYTPGWSRDAGFAWILAAAFFTSLILFVRFQIESMSTAPARAGSRRRFRLALFSFHALLIPPLAAIALNGGAYRWTITVFAPVIAQAFIAGTVGIPVTTVRRLGWLQIAHTLLFVLLAAIFLGK